MTRFRQLLLICQGLLLCLLTVGQCVIRAQQAMLPDSLWQVIGEDTYMLDNGLTVHFIPTKKLPLTSLTFVIDGGLASQYSSFEGIPAILSKLLLSNSTAYSDLASFRHAKTNTLHALTSSVQPHCFLLQTATLDMQLSSTLSFVHNLLTEPSWDTLYVGRALTDMKQMLQQRETPALYQHSQVDQFLWGKSYGLRNLLPEFYQLRKISRTTMADYHNLHFSPKSTTLILQTGLKPKYALAQISHAFGQWQGGGSLPRPRTVHNPFATDTLLSQTYEAQETPLVTLAWQLPPASEDPAVFYAAMLFAKLLNLSTAFSLPKSLRGAVYGFQAAHDATNLTSSLRLSALVEPAAVPRFVAHWQQQVASIINEQGPSSKLLSQAKALLYADLLKRKDAPTAYALWVANMWKLWGVPPYPSAFRDSIYAVKPHQVQDFVRQFLHEKPMVTALLANSEVMADEEIQRYFQQDYVRQRVATVAEPLLANTVSEEQTPTQPQRQTDPTREGLDSLAMAGLTEMLKDEEARKAAGIGTGIPTKEEIEGYAVHYDYGHVLPDDAAEDIISRVVLYLNVYPASKVVIRAHTDLAGSKQANIRMSERRALRLKQYIIAKYRIMPQRLSIRAMGPVDPLVPEVDDASRRLNRRVQFDIQ